MGGRNRPRGLSLIVDDGELELLFTIDREVPRTECHNRCQVQSDRNCRQVRFEIRGNIYYNIVYSKHRFDFINKENNNDRHI